MKAMVIIDMPICCGACRLFQNNGNDCWCSITREDTTSLAMPESCPLKPLPTTKQIENLICKKGYGFMEFDELLDEILGEEE